MATKKTVMVTHWVEVEVDGTRFTEDFLAEYRASFYDLGDLDDHIRNLAILAAEGKLQDFTEGYGEIADFSIRATVSDVETELEPQD